jgi:hypothetical protein
MKRALLPLALVALVASLGIVAAILDSGATSKERQFYLCRLDAVKRYPEETSPRFMTMQFMRYCMGAAGYEHVSRPEIPAVCSSMTDAEGALLTSQCYAPMGRFSRGLQRFEKWVLPPIEPPPRSVVMTPGV